MRKKTRTNLDFSLRTYLPIILLTLFLTACEQKVTHTPFPPKTVAWIKLKKEDSHVQRKISGIVQSANKASVSFEVSGKVARMYFELGEKFQRGDLLAELDSRIYALTVKQRESEYLETKARITEYYNDHQRKKYLLRQGSISKSEYEIALSQYETARKQIDVAKARLRIAQEDLKNTKIVAPYNGTVSIRYVEPSQYLGAGEPVFEIQGLKKLEVSALVPETMVSQIHLNQEVRVYISAISEMGKVQAKISEIGTRAENANSFPITLSFQKNHPLLKSGMTAEVYLRFSTSTATENIFRIPVTAFAAGRQQDHYVMLIENDDSGSKLKQVPVTIQEFFGQEVLVNGSLHKGQQIVRTGLVYLRNGQQVRPLGYNQINYNE